MCVSIAQYYFKISRSSHIFYKKGFDSDRLELHPSGHKGL